MVHSVLNVSTCYVAVIVKCGHLKVISDSMILHFCSSQIILSCGVGTVLLSGSTVHDTVYAFGAHQCDAVLKLCSQLHCMASPKE